MTCPRCFAEFEPGQAGACPECGVTLVRNVSGVMKTSAVMIAAGEEQGFYHSVQDVPEPLRTQLIRITSGVNAGTIVIADRAGKEQMTQVMSRKDGSPNPSGTPAGVASGGEPGSGPASKVPSCLTPGVQAEPAFPLLGISWIVWAGTLLLLIAAGIITAVFVIHW